MEELKKEMPLEGFVIGIKLISCILDDNFFATSPVETDNEGEYVTAVRLIGNGVSINISNNGYLFTEYLSEQNTTKEFLFTLFSEVYKANMDVEEEGTLEHFINWYNLQSGKLSGDAEFMLS